jgi:hypothetical protein
MIPIPVRFFIRNHGRLGENLRGVFAGLDGITPNKNPR